MDVACVDKARRMLGKPYASIYLFPKNRPPAGMAYFDNMIAELHGAGGTGTVVAKKDGRPVIGTFCGYIPEEIVVAAGGVCIGLCGGSHGSIPDAENTTP